MTATALPRVHGVAVPTPFAIGDVNVYLVEGDPLTLIDTGPNSATSLLALEHALDDLGYAVADLELLLITHQHGDHLGLTEALVERSGADVACLAALAPYVRDFKAAAGRDDDLAAELMLAHGVPPASVRTLREFTTVIRGWGSSFEVTRELHDGDTIEVGSRALRVLHRPGHSASDTIFVNEHAGVAFGGDHLLPITSSNALFAQPLDGSAGVFAADRPHPLIDYLESMRATRALGLEVILPGHGDPVIDPAALVDRRLGFHEERAARILDIVRERPRSAHEIALEIWGKVASTQPFLTTSEVIGHLDLLASRELVGEDATEDIVHFYATGGST